MAFGLRSTLILSIHPVGIPKSPFFYSRIVQGNSFPTKKTSIQCVENPKRILRTCKNCKTQFNPSLNHPTACRFHTSHFGGDGSYNTAPPTEISHLLVLRLTRQGRTGSFSRAQKRPTSKMGNVELASCRVVQRRVKLSFAVLAGSEDSFGVLNALDRGLFGKKRTGLNDPTVEKWRLRNAYRMNRENQ